MLRRSGALLVAWAGVAAYGLTCGRVFAGLTGTRTAQSNSGVRTSLAASSLWLPDERLVETVQDLGGRVTKADVLARGVPAAGLERELLQLARASGASLQVSSQGELLFEFPENLPRELRRRSTMARLRGVWQKAAPWFGWGGRVLFGVSLVSVVALVFCAFIIVATSSSNRDNGDGNRPVISSDTSLAWFGNDVFFWLMPRPYGYYGYCGGDVLYSQAYNPPPKLSFLESVFSFVFGDGDPNTQLRNEGRWQLMGECIAKNGGAVVAEQLAPYLDPVGGSSSDEATRQREQNDAMLPVLLRFKGKAEVSAEGDIVYVFPELQESRAAAELILSEVSTEDLQARLQQMGSSAPTMREDVVAAYQNATARMREQGVVPSLSFLPEKKLKFSEADSGQVATCIGLAGFAFVALLYLGSQLHTPKMIILSRISPVVALFTASYPWLLGYITAFLAIPGLRLFRLLRKNRRIEERNLWRSEQAAKLRQPVGRLRNKLKSAAKWALRRKYGDTVYDSSESASVRQRKSEAEDLEAFDRLMSGKG